MGQSPVQLLHLFKSVHGHGEPLMDGIAIFQSLCWCQADCLVLQILDEADVDRHGGEGHVFGEFPWYP